MSTRSVNDPIKIADLSEATVDAKETLKSEGITLKDENDVTVRAYFCAYKCIKRISNEFTSFSESESQEKRLFTKVDGMIHQHIKKNMQKFGIFLK